MNGQAHFSIFPKQYFPIDPVVSYEYNYQKTGRVVLIGKIQQNTGVGGCDYLKKKNKIQLNNKKIYQWQNCSINSPSSQNAKFISVQIAKCTNSTTVFVHFQDFKMEHLYWPVNIHIILPKHITICSQRIFKEKSRYIQISFTFLFFVKKYSLVSNSQSHFDFGSFQ